MAVVGRTWTHGWRRVDWEGGGISFAEAVDVFDDFEEEL